MSKRPKQAKSPDQLEQWRIQALTALSQGEIDLANRLAGLLQQTIPEHPAVVDLLRRCAIASFNYPLARTNCFVQGRAVLPEQSSIDLVIFHVELPVAPSGWHVKTDYLAVLRAAFAIAARRAPQAKRILLTDTNTSIPDDILIDEIHRFPINTAHLMYERMRVQESYLASRLTDRYSILMDSDVAVNRDPCEAFAQDYDVGLTWRSQFPDAPFNGGLLLVGPGKAGLTFFRHAGLCYERMATSTAIASLYPLDLRNWWGDQYALAATVGHRAFAHRQADTLLIDGIRVMFFPCAEYNYTLEEKRNYDEADLAQKFFIHFKGNRKNSMIDYFTAQALLSSCVA